MQQPSRNIIGIILVAVGAIILADNLYLFNYDIGYYLLNWNSILIAVGIVIIANNGNRNAAFILIFAGGIGLIARLTGFRFWYFIEEYWALLLILAGLLIIFKRSGGPEGQNGGKGPHTERTETDEDKIDISAIFAAPKIKVNSAKFLGGRITAIFGGANVDLRESKLAEGTNYLETVSIFGGSELRIPSEWNVIDNSFSMFGGVSDSRSPIPKLEDRTGTGRTLIIKGISLFGGNEIKD